MQLTIARRKSARARQRNGLTFTVFSLILSGIVGGCGSGSFDIVDPPQWARHIPTDSDAVVELKPVAYRFRSVEDHLVVRIFNPGEQPVSVLGPDSSVVDPQGRSHAIASQAIPPGSFVKLILPPVPPGETPGGPYLSFQVSSGGVSMTNPLPPAESSGSPRPDSWTWSGKGNLELKFTYRTGSGKPFTHSFSIRRHKP